MNPNVYVADLLELLAISCTFNVADLFLYHSLYTPMYLDFQNDLRASFSQVGEIDVEWMFEEFWAKTDCTNED